MNNYYTSIMSRNKRKTMLIDSEDGNSPKQRRSSLAVNLSYTNLTDSGHGSFKKNQSNNESSRDNEELDEMQYFDKSSNRRCTINKRNSINSSKTNKILQNVHVRVVDIKHIRKTDADYDKLRNAILNKTKELFNKQDECAIKTNLVLASDNNSIDNENECQFFKDKVTNNDALSPTSESNTPSNKISIFSTPVHKSPNLQRLINSSKITGRKLFKCPDNLENDLPSSSSIVNRNHNSSPIITGSDKKQCILKRSFKNIPKIARKSNVQDEQDSVSSFSISTDGTGSIGVPIFCSTFNEDFTKKDKISEENNVNSKHLENMNVNVVSMELTSLQEHRTTQGRSTFIEKINATNTNSKNKSNSKEKSKIQEIMTNSPTITSQTSQHNIEKNANKYISDNSKKNMEDHELSLNVNTSLDNEVWDKNNSKKSVYKEMTQASTSKDRSSLQVNTSLNSTYKSKLSYNKEQQDTRMSKQHLNPNRKSTDEDNDCSSYIKCTPYPAPRTVQSKSQLIYNTIRQNGESNRSETIDVSSKSNIQDKDKSASSLRNKSCLHKIPTTHSIVCGGKEKKCVHNSIIVNDSPINTLDKQQYKEMIIDDTFSGAELGKRKTNNNSAKNENVHSKPNKKKLLPLCDYSMLSISPREELEHLSSKEPSITKKQKKFKKTTKMKKFVQQSLQTQIYPNTSTHNNNSMENNFLTYRNEKKESKKVRKVKSKKIVIKKRPDSDILKQLENLHTCSDEEAEFPESRNSLNVFQTRKEVTQRLLHKSQKIIIVVTGFSNGDKNLIKKIVKTLGMARIESHVTRRTTHVITTGVRTLNLLYGIIRGCWLLKLEWVLESLENNGWLNPEQYEVAHFSKAVQENRKDRELFGMSYVPELFTTCGFLHVENETTPPSHTLKELIKTAGGRITENPQSAKIIIGANGIKESWVLDSITSGNLQPITQYQNQAKKLRFSTLGMTAIKSQ